MPYFTLTPLALRWALRKPPTRRYPFEPRRLVPRSRGALAFHKPSCVFCTVCARKCPTGALSVHRAQRRWTVDRLLCIHCAACVEACPKKSLVLTPDHAPPVVTKDREVH